MPFPPPEHTCIHTYIHIYIHTYIHTYTHTRTLAWFKSYLSGRTLRIKIDKLFSKLQDILWSVPHGSVLGPLLFLMYLIPLGKLIRKHGSELHIYADVTQLYLSIKPITQQAVDLGVARLEGCLTDIYSWMSQNKLKLNADKTEVLVLGTPTQRAKISVPSISVNGEIVSQYTYRQSGLCF